MAVEVGNGRQAVTLVKERATSWQQGKSSVWCKSAGLGSSRQMTAARSSSIDRESKAQHSRCCERDSVSPLMLRRGKKDRVHCTCTLQRPLNRAEDDRSSAPKASRG